MIVHGLTDHPGRSGWRARASAAGSGECGMMVAPRERRPWTPGTWPRSTLEPHQPAVLRSDDETRVIAINLPAGERLQEHQVHERAWCRGRGGEVEVEQDGAAVSGGPGLLAHFEPDERHEVRANSDARLILLLSPWPGEGHPSRRDG